MDTLTTISTDYKVKQYQFSSDIIKKVQALYDNDNLHGVLETAKYWLIIGISITVSLYSIEHFNIFTTIPILLVSIFIIGGKQRGLADILHQSIHGTLTNNKKINYVLGTYFSGWLIFQSFSGYKASHLRHHYFLGCQERDPDFEEYKNANLTGKSSSIEEIKAYLKNIFSPLSMFRYFIHLSKYRLWSKEEKNHERTYRIVFYIILLTIIMYCNFLIEYLVFWIVPLLTTQLWIGSFVELLEHYPMINKQPKVDIYMSRNRVVNKYLSFVMGASSQEGYHLLHHKFPKVPTWRAKEAHNILMGDKTYNELNKKTGFKNMIQSLLLG